MRTRDGSALTHRTDAVRLGGDLGDRVDCADDVGHVREADQARALAQERFQIHRIQLAGFAIDSVNESWPDASNIKSSKCACPFKETVGQSDLIAGISIDIARTSFQRANKVTKERVVPSKRPLRSVVINISTDPSESELCRGPPAA